MVYANQQKYYDAINASTNAGQSGPFIDFMLGEIYQTLKAHQGEPLPTTNDEFGIKFGIKFGISDKQILLALHSAPSSTAAEIAQRIGISQRAVEKQMKKFKDLGIIRREGSRKNGLWVINNQEEDVKN